MSLINLIAIDGPAASGKSTLAEKIAHELGFFYFDTGVMYRAVTLAALRQNILVEDETSVSSLASSIQIDVQKPSQADGRMMDVFVNGEDVTWQIRTPEVDRNVSKVSAYAGVRKAMTEQQRRIGERGQMVMVGGILERWCFRMLPAKYTLKLLQKSGRNVVMKKIKNGGSASPMKRS
jgi:cytidylate kinase